MLILESPRNQTTGISFSGVLDSKIHAAKPVFMRGAEALQGRLLIDASGVVNDVVVVETRLPEVFEQSARDALTSIRFKPAEKDGKAVGCETVISIVYAGAGVSAAPR